MIINGVSVPDPEDYAPGREAVYINEMQNGNGEKLADFLRYRTTLSLSWPFMPPDTLTALQAATNTYMHPDITVIYSAPGEEARTGRFRVTRPITGKRLDIDALYGLVWCDVALELMEV